MITIVTPPCEKCGGLLQRALNVDWWTPPLENAHDYLFCTVCGTLYKIDTERMIDLAKEATSEQHR